jgi:hypothetical protein
MDKCHQFNLIGEVYTIRRLSYVVKITRSMLLPLKKRQKAHRQGNHG